MSQKAGSPITVIQILNLISINMQLCRSQKWQPWVEIEHYSVVYFARITIFEALQRRTSVKGGAHARCVNVVSIDEFTQRV